MDSKHCKQRRIDTFFTVSSNVSSPEYSDDASTAKDVKDVSSEIEIKNDIACLVQRDMNDKQRYEILTSSYVPDESFNFRKRKIGTQNRSFQLSWLKSNPWMAYSPREDGAYCRYCVCFAPPFVSQNATAEHL